MYSIYIFHPENNATVCISTGAKSIQPVFNFCNPAVICITQLLSKNKEIYYLKVISHVCPIYFVTPVMSCVFLLVFILEICAPFLYSDIYMTQPMCVSSEVHSSSSSPYCTSRCWWVSSKERVSGHSRPC